MRYDQMTGTELNRAHEAADYLIKLNGKALILDPVLSAKLDSFRADLVAEQEERRELSRS